jgi:hypothetical protein
MEAEWLRLEHKGTAASSKDKVRQWFVCEVPDEDENSGDDDWCHVADVFANIESGVVMRIDVVLVSDVNRVFGSDVDEGKLERVIVSELRSACESSFYSEVPLYRVKLKTEEDFVYFSNSNLLI